MSHKALFKSIDDCADTAERRRQAQETKDHKIMTRVVDCEFRKHGGAMYLILCTNPDRAIPAANKNRLCINTNCPLFK